MKILEACHNDRVDVTLDVTRLPSMSLSDTTEKDLIMMLITGCII